MVMRAAMMVESLVAEKLGVVKAVVEVEAAYVEAAVAAVVAVAVAHVVEVGTMAQEMAAARLVMTVAMVAEDSSIDRIRSIRVESRC